MEASNANKRPSTLEKECAAFGCLKRIYANKNGKTKLSNLGSYKIPKDKNFKNAFSVTWLKELLNCNRTLFLCPSQK